ncbi:LysR family transcriptional regulator [Methyloversatilis thermotolerans]|uniref:LysR family transcriptional regulator n=1 Tax=Methyloversatilis thermotolerans TaxID=1346290 RepID=UPI000362797C|nr:LysR family transcriptional regulator [Methyloversatilis thermotolerans]
MELRHLRYFLTVAQELHFTRAAEKLGIGQPPLSQQIKQLEHELGVTLFHRETRSVSLTEAGRAFMPHAQAVLREADQAVLAARRAARGEQGQIRIGFTSASSFNPSVPAIISGFRERYPEVEISLVEQATEALVNALEAGQIDIAFVRPTQGQREGLVTRALPAERLWLALPKRHPLSGRSALRLIELANDMFVLYPRLNGSLLYDSIIAACRNAGFSPRIAQEAPQMTSTVNLVAAGVGIAIVPESMRQLHPEGVVYVEIEDDTPPALLWVAHTRSSRVPPMTLNFMRHVDDYLARIEAGVAAHRDRA